MGARLPRNTMAWTSLKLIADLLGEVSTASLVQTSVGHLEMRWLRYETREEIAAREMFYYLQESPPPVAIGGEN